MIVVDIYSDYIDDRLNYVCNYIFSDRLKVKYQLIENIDNFRYSSNSIKCYYGTENVDADLKIHCSHYFDDFNIDKDPEILKQLKFVNGTSEFDVFAAIFFLLARVEEYRDCPRDIHGRFNCENTLLFRKNLFEIPVIDFWIRSIKSQLEIKLNNTIINKEKYGFKSTLDIDQFYAYKNKPLYIQVGSLLRDIFLLKFGRIKDRYSKSDPYDNIDEILNWHLEIDIRPTLFILCASGGKYDNNIDPASKSFASKLKSIMHKCELAIHPSYDSNSDSILIRREKEILGNLTNSEIIRSRQHYLRMSFPYTYRALINAGIKEDYSMACHERIGFRAGTSRSFSWFDLEKNEVTELRIYPFSVMDVTLRNYMNLSPIDALQQSKVLIDSIKSCEGEFCLLWHNSSFYEREGWHDWKKTYLELLNYAKTN